MATSEREVEMIRVGDEAPEAALYRAHRVELVRFASALVGPSDAADVVSDAVLSLLRSGSVRDAHSPLGLLYRAVSAKAASLHRSRFRRRARERRFAEPLARHAPSVHPEVFAAVASLSVRQRACVYLTYWEDLPPRAVADRLGIGEGTVKRYLARARTTLKGVLNG